MEAVMINDFLPYEEQKALEAILRKHGKGQDTMMAKDLATFCNWIHAHDQAQTRFNRTAEPPFLLTLLSSMGIYGAAALDPPKETTHDQA
jgi:hypothetical protein